jgi:hypothetical protein
VGKKTPIEGEKMFKETVSTGMHLAYIGPKGGITIECPLCTFKKHATLPKKLYNKSVRVTCACKNQFVVLFCSRSHYRKKIDLIGAYWDSERKKRIVVFDTLSHTGASFNTGNKEPDCEPGYVISIEFRLNYSTWIKTHLEVVRVESGRVGGRFIGLSEHHQKQIGYFLR